MRLLLVFLAVAAVVNADVYFHNPRGSNNRLNENTIKRQNGNRLFDSQNNAVHGGYNVGVKGTARARYEKQQHRMKYFQSSATAESYLTLEWTNQHGCGEDKQNCNLVIQYMCQPHDPDSAEGSKEQDYFRNGIAPNTQNHVKRYRKIEEKERADRRRTGSVYLARGQHESFNWYDKCAVRERNLGLFNAEQANRVDKILGYSTSIYTRQNAQGNRHGYECPEERDYYPYWQPTPWVDIAVLTDASKCSEYTRKSFNVQPYHECIEYWAAGQTQRKHYSRYITEAGCTGAKGKWTALHSYLEKNKALKSESTCLGANGEGVTHIWGIPYDSDDGKTSECLVSLPAPECREAPKTRSNHLGNSAGTGEMSRFTWKIPHFPSMEEKRCVMRIRYNISTDDYPETTDSKSNKPNSPITGDPAVDVGGMSLRLAINTAQFGRTFQDRSHVFILSPRPADLQNERIYNLNVRGKRGALVDIYPAFEYDFIPNDLQIKDGDLVHVQWTGSNSNNANNAGEGTKGTDRSNLVQIEAPGRNYPLETPTMWTGAEIKWIYHGHNNVKPEDLAINMASSGYYMCVKAAGCPDGNESLEKKAKISDVLNNAPTTYEGALIKFKKGKYYYMCTRNNNFTNRNQKGSLTVV